MRIIHALHACHFSNVRFCCCPCCFRGQYEIEFIRRLESHDKASTEWDCVINRPQCTVYKFKGDSPVVLVKAYVVFDGVSVGILSHFIRHVPTRSNW